MGGKNECRSDVVPGADELFEAPPEYRLCLRLVDQFELGRSHVPPPSSSSTTGNSSASSAPHSARLRSRVAAPKVRVAATSLPRPRDALPRTSDDGSIGLPRDTAGGPHAAPLVAGDSDGIEEHVGVPTLVTAKEVRRRRASSDELDVHVEISRVDVPQQPCRIDPRRPDPCRSRARHRIPRGARRSSSFIASRA